MKYLVLLLLFIGCPCPVPSTEAKDTGPKFAVSSPAFQNMAEIPGKYTCDGADINPPLRFEGIPGRSKSLALIVDDPDAPAGTWVHWVLWNIDPSTRDIPEKTVPSGAVQGVNSFKKHPYGGPCPPSGSHRYFFKLYALDATLNISSGASKADLERAMRGHIIGKAELVGKYERK